MNTETMPTKTEFKFNCPSCGQHILVAAVWAGVHINCPSCQNRIAIPSQPGDETNTTPARSSNAARPTIRIEVPSKSREDIAPRLGQVEDSKSASRVTPTATGSEPWPDLVRRLEQGALVDPAMLATALFHELTNVRRRLDEVEKQLARQHSSAGGNGATKPTATVTAN